jgi:hypothetical protein
VREVDDYLLFAVSAWRQMSWQNFKNVVDALYLKYASVIHSNGNARHRAWRSLRALESLGHADAAFGESQSTVFCSPPALCRLPISGFPQAVLCGARSPTTEAALEDACRGFSCRLSIERHPGDAANPFIPGRVAVESESQEALSQLALRLRVPLSPAPPAWVLLEYSGTAEEYALSRPIVQAPEIDWPRLDSDTDLLRFRSPSSGARAERLSKYQHPTRGTTLYQFWDGGAYQNVDRDWGRYLVLKKSTRNVLAYDARHFLFAVPASVPLPRILARACALCSGYAPRPGSRRGGPVTLPAHCEYDIFSGVPPDIATTTAAKVGQTLVPTTLDGFLED